MNARLDDPEATWPGVLFLEVRREGLVIGEMRPLEGVDELDKQDLATMIPPDRIRRSKADRFGWVMPAWRHDMEPPTECLVLLLGWFPARTGRAAVVLRLLRGESLDLLAREDGPACRADRLLA